MQRSPRIFSISVCVASLLSVFVVPGCGPNRSGRFSVRPCQVDADCGEGASCREGLCVLNVAFEPDADTGVPAADASGDVEDASFDTSVEDAASDALSDVPTPSDLDLDGVLDADDNCPARPNRNQLDNDLDGVGDACDVCPSFPDAGQRDIDGDGLGDACDACPHTPLTYADDEDCAEADSDGDGVLDGLDVCPVSPDPEQSDRDNDGVGDACDACPSVANHDQRDRNGDGVGDACERGPDSDADGWPDLADNCPQRSNPSQRDRDRDGAGDACDACIWDPSAGLAEDSPCSSESRDSDGDGVLNGEDNCPAIVNPAQLDVDQNDVGDLCDRTFGRSDTDGDGVVDAYDSALTASPDAARRGR